LEETGKKGIILRWHFKKQNGIGRSTFIWLWSGTEWYGMVWYAMVWYGKV